MTVYRDISEDEYQRLHEEIHQLRLRLLTAAGDDLCRLSQEEIDAMKLGKVQIPPKEEFLASCEIFHWQMSRQGGVMKSCFTLAQLVAENEKLRSQLPEGMQHCTILCKQCKKGHAWLTATNWIQHECPTCERDDLKRGLALANEIINELAPSIPFLGPDDADKIEAFRQEFGDE